ncbi:PTS sugar transporter subunit IIC [Priestia megaterium]|uniref:Permease IIC component n=1 Tax=Priestia megaterium TaxID=1404 RepID=A0A6H1NZ05_PRIMG|nr:PTS transporter subunit EIIC [Priestia megaterium]QIZ06455.1 PTS sugar transporter subunit IIC [Priestia megaterium]
MRKILDFFQDKVMDFFVAIGENKYMQAIRNGMMMVIPFIIVGSLFTIISSFPFKWWTSFIEPYVKYFNVGYDLTFGMIAIIATIGIAYNLAKALKIDAIGTSLTALIGFLVLQVAPPEFKISTANFGASGLFTAIIVGLLTAKVIEIFYKRNITIKLPKGVPSYVSDSFTILIPSFTLIVGLWLIRVPLNFDINALITKIISPLVFGLDTLPGVLVLVFFTLLLWICGINGDSIFGGIYYPVMLGFLADNAAASAAGEPIPHVIADGFYYFGMWFGGTGGTIGLVILMLLSKSKTFKSLGKICLPPGIFCINEPLVFGFPIMLNPIIMIPYILTPIILLTITYFLMSFGIIGKPIVSVPWTTPPIISGFLVTGGDWRAAVWQAIELVFSVCIYYPFFKVAERIKLKEEEELLQDEMFSEGKIANEI